MGGLSKVHMPSSARAGTLAANNPQDSRAAREREDAKLLMLFGLLFCPLCETKKNGGYFLFPSRCPARKRMHYAERNSAVWRLPVIPVTREKRNSVFRQAYGLPVNLNLSRLSFGSPLTIPDFE